MLFYRDHTPHRQLSYMLTCADLVAPKQHPGPVSITTVVTSLSQIESAREKYKLPDATDWQAVVKQYACTVQRICNGEPMLCPPVGLSVGVACDKECVDERTLVHTLQTSGRQAYVNELKHASDAAIGWLHATGLLEDRHTPVELCRAKAFNFLYLCQSSPPFKKQNMSEIEPAVFAEAVGKLFPM